MWQTQSNFPSMVACPVVLPPVRMVQTALIWNRVPVLVTAQQSAHLAGMVFVAMTTMLLTPLCEHGANPESGSSGVAGANRRASQKGKSGGSYLTVPVGFEATATYSVGIGRFQSGTGNSRCACVIGSWSDIVDVPGCIRVSAVG